MHRFPTSALFVVLTLLLSGCYISVRDDEPHGSWLHDSDDWEDRQERNRDAMAHLELGRTLSSVTSELGAPDREESFVRSGQTFQVLFYRTHRVHRDGRTTRDETTPLVFTAGELVGWGESAIEHAMP